MKMKIRIQSKNPLLRGWGNFCGKIADLFLDQSIKYGDLYELERFLDDFGQIQDIDDTFAWKDDE
jgi:hypothetical protein